MQTFKGKYFYLVNFVGMTTKDILNYVVFLLFFCIFRLKKGELIFLLVCA